MEKVRRLLVLPDRYVPLACYITTTAIILAAMYAFFVTLPVLLYYSLAAFRFLTHPIVANWKYWLP